LRMKGRIPGVFYYRGKDNIPLSVESVDFNSLVRAKPSLIQLEIEGYDTRECVIRELQRDPVTDEIIHVDLLGIKRGQKLKVTISVRLNGIPNGVKNSGGILQQIITELDVECLPKDIPQRIELDVTSLEIGKSINVGDLDFPKLKFLADPKVVITSVVEPTVLKEKVPEDEEVEEAEEEKAEETEKTEKSD